MPQSSGAVEHDSLVAAVDQAADSILITDTGGNIQYVNPAFTAMTGYSRGEVLGRNPRLLKSGRQSAEFYRELWSTLRRGGVWSGNMLNRRKDGRFYDAEIRISLVQDSNCEAAGYIAIERDITERRAREEATARLLASMSREIRTPMSGVLGMIQLLLETNLTEEQRRYAGAARTGGKVLLTLIDDFLVLAKIQRDGYEASSGLRVSSDPPVPFAAVPSGAIQAGRGHTLGGGMSGCDAEPVEAKPAAEMLAEQPNGTLAEDAPAVSCEFDEEPGKESFDGESLLERLAGDRRLARVVLKGCLHDLPAQVSNLRRQLRVGDAEGVRSQACTLMAAASTVAADGLRVRASEIEGAAASGQLDRCRELLPRLVGEFERFKRAIARDGWL